MRKYIWLIISATLILGLVFLFLILNNKPKPDENGVPNITEKIEKAEIIKKYGIPVDSFKLINDTVRKGNTLSDLLIPYKVSPAIIDKIGKLACDSFPVDEIRSGKPFVLFCDKNDTSSFPKAQFMVYENNGIDYTIYDFRDSLNIRNGEKPVNYVQKFVCGSINSSLWKAFKEKNANPILALEMSELYSWTIDFFGIKKGDKFRLIYEVAEVEGRELFINKIVAGYMKHIGEDYWAIPFTVNDTTDFYDDKGESLKKAFLKAPLRYNRISSRFTNSRMHPILHYRRPHRAIDYSAPTGTPILSIGDGNVILRKYGRGAGNYIKVKHNSIYTSVYMHMSKFGDFQTGDRVKQGDVIGYVGSTGLSTGPHLHFEVHKNGAQIDPLKLKSPPSKPVPDSLMQDYNLTLNKWKNKIMSVDCNNKVIVLSDMDSKQDSISYAELMNFPLNKLSPEE